MCLYTDFLGEQLLQSIVIILQYKSPVDLNIPHTITKREEGEAMHRDGGHTSPRIAPKEAQLDQSEDQGDPS
jgi:hypothetical protein